MQHRMQRGLPEGGQSAEARHPEPDVVPPDSGDRLSVVDADVLAIIRGLAGASCMSNFYLAGGTALALQIHHRRSNGLDFFTDADHLDRTVTRQVLERIERMAGHFDITLRQPGQIDISVGPEMRKVSFIAYPFPVPRPEILEEGQLCAGVVEIAAMKAYALGRRGVARDYVDIEGAITKGGASLDQIISAAKSRFILGGESVFSERMFLSQLVYTEDIMDKDSLATTDVSFEEAEQSLRGLVADYVRRQLR